VTHFKPKNRANDRDHMNAHGSSNLPKAIAIAGNAISGIHPHTC